MTKNIPLGSIVTVREPVGRNRLHGQSGKVVGWSETWPDLFLIAFGADVAGHSGNVDWCTGEVLKGYKPEGNRHWWVPREAIEVLDTEGTPREPTAPMTKSVLDLLRQKGTVTPAEAQFVLHCRQLPARVLELKRLGHQIVTELKRDKKGQRYARYHLLAQAA